MRPACRSADPGLFDSTDQRDHQRARSICATCPCVMACLKVALNIAGEHPHNPNRRGPHGTWGGLLWKAGHITLGAVCGTDQGYYRHLRAGNPACFDCKAAHKEVEKVRSTRRKGAA